MLGGKRSIRAGSSLTSLLHSCWGSLRIYRSGQHSPQSMPPRRRQRKAQTTPAATTAAPRPPAAPSSEDGAAPTGHGGVAPRRLPAAPLSEEAELQRALAMSAQSYTAEQSQRKAYERYAAPAGAVRGAATRRARRSRRPAPAWRPSTRCGRGPNGPCPNGGSARPSSPSWQDGRRPSKPRPTSRGSWTSLGLARFPPLLLAEEAADMDAYAVSGAEDLKDLAPAAGGADEAHAR